MYADPIFRVEYNDGVSNCHLQRLNFVYWHEHFWLPLLRPFTGHNELYK